MIWIRKWKPTLDPKGFYNYAVHILIPQNTEIGEPELNNFGDKSQDKNELILHNTIINTRWNQITNIIQGSFQLFQDSYKISHGWISTLSLSWKIIIPLYLFNRVSYDMSGLSLSKKVAQLLQSLYSMIVLIKLSLVLKSMHLALFSYLSFKAPLTMTRSTYCMIYQNDTYTNS